jgi:uncharacterized DUF497 family protein
MRDISRIEGFDWDDGNRRKSAEKHDVEPGEAEQVFQDARVLIASDIKHSAREPRFQALGCSFSGRHLHIAFTLRRNGTLIRVISARDMNRKERKVYEQEAETDPAL